MQWVLYTNKQNEMRFASIRRNEGSWIHTQKHSKVYKLVSSCFTKVIRWQRHLEAEKSGVRPHSCHGMVVTAAYHRIWLGLRDLCRWFLKILCMAVMILSQEETHFILIYPNHRSSVFNALIWLMLAVSECECDRVYVFLRRMNVNVFLSNH